MATLGTRVRRSPELYPQPIHLRLPPLVQLQRASFRLLRLLSGSLALDGDVLSAVVRSVQPPLPAPSDDVSMEVQSTISVPALAAIFSPANAASNTSRPAFAPNLTITLSEFSSSATSLNAEFSYSRRVIISHRRLFKSRSTGHDECVPSFSSEVSLCLSAFRKTFRFEQLERHRRSSGSPSLSASSPPSSTPLSLLPAVTSTGTRLTSQFALLYHEMDDLIILRLVWLIPLSQSPARQTSDVPNTRSSPSDAVTPVKASPLPVLMDSGSGPASNSTGVFSSPPAATRQPLPTSNALVPFSHNFDTPDFCKR